MSNAVTTPEVAAQLVSDPEVLQRMHRAVQRNAARRVGIAEVDIERAVYVRWRLERAVLLHCPETEGEFTLPPVDEAS